MLTLANGQMLRGSALCRAINNQDRSVPVLSLTPAQWQAFRRAPGCDAKTFPAFKPPLWMRFFNSADAPQALALYCQPGGEQKAAALQPQDTGGFYGNRDGR